MASSGPPMIRPEQTLPPGRAEAAAVVGTWLLRRSFIPLTLFGVAVAWVGGRTDASVEWSSPSQVAEDLVSPLAVLIVAVAIRLAASVGAVLAAVPLARRTASEAAPDAGTFTLLGDTFRTARALRTLRWTGPVRDLAIERLGPRFAWIRHGGTAMTVAAVLGGVALFAAVAAFPAT